MTVIRSFDVNVLTAALAPYDYKMEPDNQTWLNVPGNIMYTLGDDVGMATYDYPGLYAVHWFFKSKGKAALKTAAAMLGDLFENQGAKVVRGVIHMDNLPSRRLAKYVGFQRISVEEFLDGPNELMILPKEVFNQFKEKINGS